MSSQNTLPVTDGMAASQRNANGPVRGLESDLTPEAKACLVARAKDVIAGQVCPPAIVLPPELERAWQREMAGFPQPPSPEFVRNIIDRMSLEAQYKGELVAVTTAADGHIAVLAAGLPEIRALLAGLTPDEDAKVLLTDTMP